MRELAQEEHHSLITSLTAHLQATFPSLLFSASSSSSSTAHLSALIELKSGVGGSESSLFVSDLLRMYMRLSHDRKWHPTVMNANEIDTGGLKDVILEVKGEGAYEALRWESGVHRVQRVPATEASGRVHTSTVAAVVCVSLSCMKFKHG